MSWLSIVLLAVALLVLVGAEWPKLEGKFGGEARRRRERSRRKATLKLVRTQDDVLRSETEEFAASVERDLSRLPTIEERKGNGRGRERR